MAQDHDRFEINRPDDSHSPRVRLYLALRQVASVESLRGLQAEILALTADDRDYLRPHFRAARDRIVATLSETPSAQSPAVSPPVVGFVPPAPIQAPAPIAQAPEVEIEITRPDDGPAVVEAPAPVQAPAQVVAPIPLGSIHYSRRERAPVAPVAAPAVVESPVIPRLGRADLIAGAVAAGHGRLYSWAGAGRVARRDLRAALESIGRAELLPPARSARAQAGRAVEGLRGRRYDVRAVRHPKVGETAWPADVVARWVVGAVGRALDQDAVDRGNYGRVILVVDLFSDGGLSFAGSDGDLAGVVRADYQARVDAEVYTSEDLTDWLQTTLRVHFHAVPYGVNRYVPAGCAGEAQALVEAVSALWGTSWCKGLPVASGDELLRGLAEAFTAEIGRLEAEVGEAEARSVETKRGTLGPRAAGTLWRGLQDARERVAGYEALLGAERLAGARARLAALEARIRPFVADAAARGAVLEIE